MNKKEKIKFIKSKITHIVALMGGFRDDGEDLMLELYKYETGNFIYYDFITMLDKKNVLVENYYSYLGESELYNDHEKTSYDMKYKDLDEKILDKIIEYIFNGVHLSFKY